MEKRYENDRRGQLASSHARLDGRVLIMNARNPREFAPKRARARARNAGFTI